MRIPRPGAGQPSATLNPMRLGLARMAAALRGTVAVAAGVSAIVGCVAPVSWRWLAPALVLLFGWTLVYVAVAWTRGLRAWLICADLCAAAALSLAVGHLVPSAALAGTASWVAVVASMTVVSAQLAGALRLSVPVGLLVVASFVAGQRLAGSADGGWPALTTMTVQLLAAAAVMVVAMRVERSAASAFGRLQEARASADLALARREDERAQLRLVHNGPLTTLMMALHSASRQAGRRAGQRPSATLRRRAAATLEALPRLAGAGGAGPADVRLDERLSQVVVWYEPPLRIAAELAASSVPAGVADAFAGAVSEALENTARYAGTGRAAVVLTETRGVLRVTVSDQGRGFDPDRLPGSAFGIREDLGGRMAAVGGTAAVRSSPGQGTTIELAWPRPAAAT